MGYPYILIGIILLVPNYTKANSTICEESGYRNLICTNKGLTVIPSGLSMETQSLNLSMNTFREIGENAFYLENLKKIVLNNCSIQTIDKKAFSNLAKLSKIYLSGNKITHIDPATFISNQDLTSIYLNDNHIETLNSGLFKDLTKLLNIDLSNNQIHKIHTTSFDNLPKLKTLLLNGNNLNMVDSDIINNLGELRTFTLNDNPWICDCKMSPFKNFLINTKLSTTLTQMTCETPMELSGKSFNEMKELDCKPTISTITQTTRISNIGETVTFLCIVKGSPETRVEWKHNSVANQDQRYRVSPINMESTEQIRSYLTISNLTDKDNGNYSCIAKNFAGDDEKTLFLNVESTPKVMTASVSKIMFIAFLVVSGIGMFLVIIFFIRYCINSHKKTKFEAFFQNIQYNGSTEMIERNTSKQSLNKCVVPEPDKGENNKKDVVKCNDSVSKMSNQCLDKPIANERTLQSQPSIDDKHEDIYYTIKSTNSPPKNYTKVDQLPLEIKQRLFRSISASPGVPERISSSPRSYRTLQNHRPNYHRRLSSTSSQVSYMSIMENETDNLGLRTSATGNSTQSLNIVGLPHSPHIVRGHRFRNREPKPRPDIPLYQMYTRPVVKHSNGYQTLQMKPIFESRNSILEQMSNDILYNSLYNKNTSNTHLNFNGNCEEPTENIEFNSLPGLIV